MLYDSIYILCHEYRCVICKTSYTWERYKSTIYLEINMLSGFYDLGVPKKSSFTLHIGYSISTRSPGVCWMTRSCGMLGGVTI
jgi:hypothetical protein